MKIRHMSQSDEGYIVRARQVGQSISGNDSSCGCSRSVMVSTKSGPRTEKRRTGDRDMGNLCSVCVVMVVHLLVWFKKKRLNIRVKYEKNELLKINISVVNVNIFSQLS